MKLIRTFTIAWLLVVCAFCLAEAGELQISAESACLIEASSGRMIWGLNENKIMFPASTTKIVTCLVALQQGNLNKIITIGDEIAGVEGSSLDLQVGQQITMYNLLLGMMLVSGNDAAEVVAKNTVVGGRSKFIEKMNQLAMEAGANWTNFSNPHGLPEPISHFTTASDMAQITRFGYNKMPDFKKIVEQKSATVYFVGGSSILVNNTNKLLSRYKYANGVKTGFTKSAGDCLVAAAQKNGVQLIAVIYNDDYRWDDAIKILDYGFAMCNS